MSRIPYASRNSVGAEQSEIFDRLEALRGKPVENIFLAIANAPDLCAGVMAMAMSLRQSHLLDRQLRELAVLTVGIETGCCVVRILAPLQIDLEDWYERL